MYKLIFGNWWSQKKCICGGIGVTGSTHSSETERRKGNHLELYKIQLISTKGTLQAGLTCRTGELEHERLPWDTNYVWAGETGEGP